MDRLKQKTMHHFTVQRMRFVVEARGIIKSSEHQGSAICGMLFHALHNRFYDNREAKECTLCLLIATSSVAFLVSTLDPQSERGRDVPRPFNIQPPLSICDHAVEREGRFFFRYGPGETLEFSLTLYAQALQFFPYIVLAVNEFERSGIGSNVEQAEVCWRCRRLAVQEGWAENPLTGEHQPFFRADNKMVQVLDIPIFHLQITDYVLRITPHAASLMIHLLIPTRIIEHGRLVQLEMFRFQPFFQRLMERLEALSEAFCDTPLRVDFPVLLAAADTVQVSEQHLYWEDLRS